MSNFDKYMAAEEFRQKAENYRLDKKKEVAKKMVKVKSKGKPMEFYKQSGRDGKVHVSGFKEK